MILHETNYQESDKKRRKKLRKGVYKEGKREQYTASVLRSTEKKPTVLDRLGES